MLLERSYFMTSMNASAFDALQIRILVRLQRSGPTTSEKLASEFSLPLGSVRFALAKLRDEKKMVRKLPFGFWDLPAEEEAA
jgi:hypothetical protein